MGRYENRTELTYFEYDSEGYLLKSTETTNYDRKIEPTVRVKGYSYYENHLMSQSTDAYNDFLPDTSFYEYTFYE